MKKIIFTILLLCNITYAESSEKHVYKSKEEFLIAMDKLEQEIKEEKAKTEAVIQLGKTVDKLAKKLGIDD